MNNGSCANGGGDSDGLVSVVVPVYNVEEFLEVCVDSIRNQTYGLLEIILVDDGSTDYSGKMCDNYEIADNRIKVIHKENGGLSDARNTGLLAAGGEYICFIDSDDYIKQTMIEELLAVIRKTNAQVSICQFSDVYEEKIKIPNDENEEIIVMTGKEAFKQFLMEEKKGFVTAWNKLYRTDLFKNGNIEYPVGKIHEDCFTTYQLYLKAETVVYLQKSLYFYRHRSGSIMKNTDIEKEYAIIDAYEDVLKLVNKEYKDLIDAAEYRYLLSNLSVIKKIVSWDDKSYAVRCKKNIDKIQILKNRYIKGQRRIRALILKISPRLYLYINHIVNKVTGT